MEQSGFINQVGYDFYLKLLSEEIDIIKENKPIEHSSPEINIGLYSFFPDEYIVNENLKLQLYRHLSQIQNTPDLEAFKKHVRNRFGPFPVEADNLFTEKALSLCATAFNISKLVYKNERVQIMFHPQSDIDNLQNTVYHFSEFLNTRHIRPQFSGKGDLSLSFRCGPMQLLALLFDLFKKPISGTKTPKNLTSKQ
ncbi:MAG TPA: hypothetical protein ENN84_11410 [Candidatus Marinimicrobia bacterium]|nr:hypothetical protein [Candidatus Neomarinimicrobiota bacterium]